MCHASYYSSIIRSDLGGSSSDEQQPLSKIAIHKAFIDLHESASIQADSLVLGLEVQKLYIFRLPTANFAKYTLSLSCALYA